MRAKILWSDPRQGCDDVIEMLEAAGCSVGLGNDNADRDARIPEDQLATLVADVDGIMIGAREQITRPVLEAGARLVVVSKHGVGVDNIDVRAATELGIMVTNAPIEEHRVAVAEYAVALLFALAKQLHVGDRRIRAGRFEYLPLVLLRGKVAGLVGYGQIGQRVAAMLRSFGMEILSYDPYVHDETSVDLPELLERADVVSVHAVLTPENHHLIADAALRRMKPGALLINTARGGLVDEAALAAAIREGRIAGAALNVFEIEPPPPDGPMLAPDIADRVLVTPHGAGQGVPEVNFRMPRALAEIHLEALRGRVPATVVNPEVLDHWRGRDRAPLAEA